MAKRKPPGISHEHWAERLIREAQERGEFDHLPGAGKPIPGLDKPHDPYWWVKQLLEREQIAVTPAALELRRELEKGSARIEREESEAGVRRIVAELNERIAEANRSAVSGPPTDIGPLDVEAAVAAWRRRNES